MIEHPHVQICGCARSGNTLMQCLMKCLDKIETPDDRREPREVLVPRMIRKWGCPRQEGYTFVGKQPTALEYFKGKIPDFLFMILMVRDGRDTILSTHRAKKNYVHPRRWIKDNKLVLQYQRDYPDQTMIVKYEDLVEDYQSTLRAIGERIGRELVTTWEEIAPRYKGTSFDKTMNGVRPLDTNSTQRWSLEEIHKLVDKQSLPEFCQMLVDLKYEQDDTWLKEK